MTIKKIILPFIIIIVLLTLRVTSFINNEPYFDDIKSLINQEFDVVKLAKDFFGNFNTYIFKEDDSLVSTSDEITKLEEGIYKITTSNNDVISKTSGVCVSILKKENGYEIIIKNDIITVIYQQITKCSIKIYDFINQEETIGQLELIDGVCSYQVKYEN